MQRLSSEMEIRKIVLLVRLYVPQIKQTNFFLERLKPFEAKTSAFEFFSQQSK